jgi:hypothetical protein
VGLKKARLKTRPYAAKLPFEEPSSGGELRPTYLPTLDMPSRHALELRISIRAASNRFC